MKRSVLAGVALALATGCAGHSARGAAATSATQTPRTQAQVSIATHRPATHQPIATHRFAATTDPSPLLAIPAPPPPVPRTPVDHTPIPEAPAPEMMVAQSDAASQLVPLARSTPEAPLDVHALKARLRETDAIGLFTKIALKNQVDDLLEQFRTQHGNGQSNDIAALREPYDLLVLKVLALIQDGDPALARTVAASRESIWDILADREKFNSAI